MSVFKFIEIAYGVYEFVEVEVADNEETNKRNA